MTLASIKKDISSLANPEKAKDYQRFFKTGKGAYGEGDIFLGIAVPEQRKIAKKYKHFSLSDVQKLLKSGIHEHRQIALYILLLQYDKGDESLKKEIFDLYLRNLSFVNNWDLVDLSAPKILGDYLSDKPRGLLYKLAKSKNLWERRISMLATYTFIRSEDFDDALKISEILLKDKHDLIHKAVGWMLREVGNRDVKVEERFLKKHCKQMPRTMLRYAIEKFDPKKRKRYMAR